MIKLYNEDCTETITRIRDNTIDVILTDPPYGVDFKNDFYDDSLMHVKNNLSAWFSDWKRVLKSDGYIFVFAPTKQIHLWINEGIKSGLIFKNIITTETYFIGGRFHTKNNFDFKTQFIILFTKGKARNFNKYDFITTSKSWFKDKRNKNPQEYTYVYPNIIPKELSFSNTKSTGKNSNNNTQRHPNQKSVSMSKFFIGISTNPNDIVLDPFMGSGTTGISCQQLNRNFIGIELDKTYFNIAKERIEYEQNTTI